MKFRLKNLIWSITVSAVVCFLVFDCGYGFNELLMLALMVARFFIANFILDWLGAVQQKQLRSPICRDGARSLLSNLKVIKGICRGLAANSQLRFFHDDGCRGIDTTGQPNA
jgi:hypothetical protein